MKVRWQGVIQTRGKKIRHALDDQKDESSWCEEGNTFQRLKAEKLFGKKNKIINGG